MKSLFPERFEYISGPSAETVKAFGEERPKSFHSSSFERPDIKCDVVSVSSVCLMS